jgi:hypothetical protein
MASRLLRVVQLDSAAAVGGVATDRSIRRRLSHKSVREAVHQSAVGQQWSSPRRDRVPWDKAFGMVAELTGFSHRCAYNVPRSIYATASSRSGSLDQCSYSSSKAGAQSDFGDAPFPQSADSRLERR